ncbi:hypothetical protein GCM10022232_89500 [Streptomyces plumbiresistens]|uniref:Uncharacterized protein n=1 Tax=Streptomyces plumbiresistens TaxID=511811 RepID=A0ABP7TQ64_9ACTN
MNGGSCGVRGSCGIKGRLVANVVVEELRMQAARYGTRLPGCPGLEDLVLGYLSPEHRDQCGVGCPSAALLD